MVMKLDILLQGTGTENRVLRKSRPKDMNCLVSVGSQIINKSMI